MNHEQDRSFGDLRHYVPADVLDVSFPVAVRGYDRTAVDAYIKRVNRVIAELKVSASPPAAVRHALEQAEEKVDALLEAAHQAAEQITSSAREDAGQTTGRAKTEAAELVVNTTAEADRMKTEAQDVMARARAEAAQTSGTAKADAERIVSDARADAQTIVSSAQAEADERLRRLEQELEALRERAEARMRELRADTEALWRERHVLLDDIHGMANSLAGIASAAAKRVSPEAGAAPEAEDELTEHDEREADAGDELTHALAAVGAEQPDARRDT